jgi:hypothetical protein
MLSGFACARLRFVLEAIEPVRLNAFAGSTLRGGFGHAFKRAVCIWPPGDCPRCLLKNTCSYPYIFETGPPPGAQKLRTLDQIPRPFVIEPPEGPQRVFDPGQRFHFHLVLVGRAIDYLPYFIFTFSQLGQTGVGPGRGRFELMEVYSEGKANERIYAKADGVLHNNVERVTASWLTDPESAYFANRRLVIDFQTPTRIQSEGRMQLELTFQDLVRGLLRRLSSLCYFHCGSELDVDFKGLIERAEVVRTVSSQLRWEEQERFSGRQHQRIEMGGAVGRIEFEAPTVDSWRDYAPLFAAGEWVHVGKGCVMGLGKYRIWGANRTE